jgi:prepilin-type N-terminal cleavage/methylation domain-containing protein
MQGQFHCKTWILKGYFAMKHVNHKASQQGFTLVELAIVLVIIGLIVGGVLVGQDMIRSAEIRSTMSQYEKYNTAVNAFRDKYGSIPGDMANGTRFGMLGNGNGNGQILDCSGTPGMLLGCETALFWDSLYKAQLIDTFIAAGGLATANHAANGAVTNVIPTAKIGNGNFWQVYFFNGQNRYYLSGVDTTGAGPTVTNAVVTIDAYNIDRKIDDGAPMTGVVIASEGRGDPLDTADAVTADATRCMDTSASPTVYFYNTDEDVAGESDRANCQLELIMN